MHPGHRVIPHLVWAVVAASVAVAAGGCGSGSSGSSADSDGASRPNLAITFPADGARLHAERVTVRGTVDPADATVRVLGQDAQVGDGVFSASVPLRRGTNSIDVIA